MRAPRKRSLSHLRAGDKRRIMFVYQNIHHMFELLHEEFCSSRAPATSEEAG